MAGESKLPRETVSGLDCCRPGCLTPRHRFFFKYESRRAVGRHSPLRSQQRLTVSFPLAFPASVQAHGDEADRLEVFRSLIYLFLQYVQNKKYSNLRSFACYTIKIIQSSVLKLSPREIQNPLGD